MMKNKTKRKHIDQIKEMNKDEVPSNMINKTKVNQDKLIALQNHILKKVQNGSFPNSMMQKNNQEFNYQGTKVGNWYSIGVQEINLFSYGHKPWDRYQNQDILDFNPETVEFVHVNYGEFREYNNEMGKVKPHRYEINNTDPELMNYIPFGIELEVKRRREKTTAYYQTVACDNCEENEVHTNEEYCGEFIEGDIQAYCGDEIQGIDVSKTNKEFQTESFRFLAELNASFGAVGTKIRPVWIAKEDSTVTVEYVSYPMTYRAFKMGMALNKQLFNSFVRYSKVASGWQTGTSGVHIHIDKHVLSTYQTYALLNLHYDNPDLISDIAGRTVNGDNACRWSYLQPVDSLAQVSRQKNGIPDRAGIQFTANTLELRYFRSNLKEKGLQKNVEWVQCLYHFVKTLSYQDMARDNAHNIKYFLLFIKAYKNRYKNLYMHLVKKDWIRLALVDSEHMEKVLYDLDDFNDGLEE